MALELRKILVEFGCKDYDQTMQRFLNDEDFYYEILKTMLRDDNFSQLGEALQSGDVRSAFEAAHALKGIISTCGITPMTILIEQIVEPLRIGNGDGLEQHYRDLIDLRYRLQVYINLEK